MPKNRNQGRSKNNKNKKASDNQNLILSKINNPVYSVEELQILLRTYYSKELSIKRLFYDPMPIERHYVELTMTSKQDYEERLKNLQNLKPSENRDESYETYDKLYGQTNIPVVGDLLTTDITCFTFQGRVPDSTKLPGNHHMLFTGTPGVGKTTFTDYLCFLWGNKTGYHDYHWVFRISLRNLTEEKYPKNTEYDVFDVLLRECFEPILKRPLSNLEIVNLKETIISSNNSNRALIILDGFDEIEEQLPYHLQSLLKKFFLFYRLILTSRPYNLHGLSDYGFRPTVILEITGFSPQNIDNYVTKFFTQLNPPKKEEILHLLKFIKTNPNIAGTCRIPINVELVCSAWEQQRMSETYCTMSYLYQRVLISLSIRYLKNKSPENSVKLKHSDANAILILSQTQVGFLEHFAFQTLLDNKLFIDITQTRQYISAHQNTIIADSIDLIAEQKRFGFIKTDTPYAQFDGISRYYFSHLTFRDFFAARYIACLLQQEVKQHSKKQVIYVSPFTHDWVCSEDISVSDFIRKRKFSGQYEILWWFVAGLLAESKDIITLKHFFSLLIGDHYDISYIYTMGLLIRCLDEANYYLEQFPDEMVKFIINWMKWFLTPKSGVVLSQNNVIWQRLRLSRNLFLHTDIQNYLADTLEEIEPSILEHLLVTLIQMGQMLTEDLTFTILIRVTQELEKDENTVHQKFNFQKLFRYFLSIFSLLPQSKFEDVQQIKVMFNLLSVITSTPPNPTAYNAILVLFSNNAEMKPIHLKVIDHALDNLCQIKGTTINAPVLEYSPLKEQQTIELFQRIEKDNILISLEHQMVIFKFLLLVHFHLEQARPLNQRIQKRSISEFERKYKDKINALITRYTEVFSDSHHNVRTRTTALRVLTLIPCLTSIFSQLTFNYHTKIISQLLQKHNPLRDIILNELIVRTPFFAPQPLQQLCNAFYQILNDPSETNTIRILTILCLELYYNESIFLKKYDELLLNLANNPSEHGLLRINAMVFFLRRHLGPPALPMNYEEGKLIQGLLNQIDNPPLLRWLAAMALFLWHKRTSAVIQPLLQKISWEVLIDNPLELSYYQQTTTLCYQRITQSSKTNEIDELLHSSLITEAHYLPLAYMLGKTSTEFILQFLLQQNDLSQYHSLIHVIMIRHIEYGKPFYLNRQDNKLYYYENQRFSSISLKDISYEYLQDEFRLALQELLQMDISMMNSELAKSLNQIPSSSSIGTSQTISSLSSPLSSTANLSPSLQMASSQAGRDINIYMSTEGGKTSVGSSPNDQKSPPLQKTQTAKSISESRQSNSLNFFLQSNSSILKSKENRMKNYNETSSLPREENITNKSQVGSSLPSKPIIPTQGQYYQIMLEELEKLRSEAVPDSWGTEDQILHYLKQIVRGRNDVIVCSYVWTLALSQQERSAQLEHAKFPSKEFFHDFLRNTQVKKFILPLIMNHSHFAGIVFVKNNSRALFELRYFNPTGEHSLASGENKEILERIKNSLRNEVIRIVNLIKQHNVTQEFYDETVGRITPECIQFLLQSYPFELTVESITIMDLSDKQQVNGSDCAYIVGQTLGEIALDRLISIGRFDIRDPRTSLQAIAQARANFCDSKMMDEKRANDIIRDQLMNRLGKALTENGHFAQELREWLKAQTEGIGALNPILWTELRTLAQRIDMKEGLKGFPGSVLADQAINYLRSSFTLKTVSNQDIRQFCDALLAPHFPEYGNVIFELNRKFVSRHTTDKPEISKGSHKLRVQSSFVSTSGIHLPENQTLLNVSGHGNNCGVFALVLAIQKESRFQPPGLPATLSYLADIPSIALQSYTAETPHIGPMLRETLSQVLKQDISFKEGRWISFSACAGDYLDKKDFSKLERDMAAFFEPETNQVILQETLSSWLKILPLLQAYPINDFLSQIEHQSLLVEEISSCCQLISKLIVNIDEQDSKKCIYQLFKVDNISQVDSPAVLIKLRRIYRAANAQNVLRCAPSEMHKKWFDEAVNRFFAQAYRQITDYESQVAIDKLFNVALLEEIQFDVEGRVSKVPSKEDVLATAKSIFIHSHLIGKWEQIYNTYCQYIKTSNVMILADELGQLARHLGVQLTVQFNDGRVYHSHEIYDSSLLQITLCNPSLDHWQVLLNHPVSERTKQIEPTSTVLLSSSKPDFKIPVQTTKENIMYNPDFSKPESDRSHPLISTTNSAPSSTQRLAITPSIDAASEFAQLTQQGQTWDDLKKRFVMGRFVEKQLLEIAGQKMKGFVALRDVIDYRIYRRAVESIFPVEHYNLDAQVRGDTRQVGDKVVFTASWYEFIITAKPEYVPAGIPIKSECRIRINAPGSRTLTSDIDTSIFTQFTNIHHFNLRHANARVRDRGPDYAGRVAVAVIDEFYRLSETEFHVSSGEHRDSNAYIDLMSEDATEYPKFQNGEQYNPTIAGQKLFSDEEFNQVFFKKMPSFKLQKHQWELAASLFSLRQALSENEWSRFKELIHKTIEQELPEQLSESVQEIALAKKQRETQEDIATVFRFVEKLYVDFETDLKRIQEKEARYFQEYRVHSPLKEEIALHHDIEIIAMNRLYVHYLDQMVDINNQIFALQECNKKLSEQVVKAQRIHQEKAKKLKIYEANKDVFADELVQCQQECATLNQEIDRDRKTLKTNSIKQAELQIEKLKCRIQAHCFANEAYVNRSAVYHVVKGMQQSGNITITQQTLLGSILQQVGFKLLHSKELLKRGKSPDEVAYLTSKYGRRIYHLLFKVADKAVEDSGIATLYRRNKNDSTLGIMHRLKASEQLKNFFYRTFSEAELRLLNLEMKIVSQIKGNDRIPDNQKPVETMRLLQTVAIENPLPLFLSIAAKVLCLTYVSRLERKQSLWGHCSPTKEIESSVIKNSNLSTEVTSSVVQSPRPPALNPSSQFSPTLGQSTPAPTAVIRDANTREGGITQNVTNGSALTERVEAKTNIDQSVSNRPF